MNTSRCDRAVGGGDRKRSNRGIESLALSISPSTLHLSSAQFNMDWDRKMGEYEAHAGDLVEAMRQRHQVRWGVRRVRQRERESH